MQSATLPFVSRALRLALVPALCLALALPHTLNAQESGAGGGMQIIRDAEIEHTIRVFASPCLIAAGIPPESVEFAIIEDSNINAFVAGGQNIFLHTGLIMAADNPLQLVGVMAHETGHIAGGHLLRSGDAMTAASVETILGAVLGAAAAAASGQGGAAAGMILGSQQMAQRSLLSFTRGQEASADSAALTFMDRAHISAVGLLTFFEKLQDQELMPQSRQEEYVRTHPLTRSRIDDVRAHVETSPYSQNKLPPEWDDMFARMNAKLTGYLQPTYALSLYSPTDPGISPRYARAIAYYRQGDMARALPLIDGLIKDEPKNPYFYEMKGQMLFDSGAIRASIAPYRQAVTLLPESDLLHAELGHSLVEVNDPALLDEATSELLAATNRDPREPFPWRLLATAWGRKHQEGLAEYALAEEATAQAESKNAKMHADKALAMLPPGSAEWLKAQDVKNEVVATHPELADKADKDKRRH